MTEDDVKALIVSKLRVTVNEDYGKIKVTILWGDSWDPEIISSDYINLPDSNQDSY